MIEVKNLSFGYKKRKLLYKNLNLNLQVGNIYGLLGKNGAGKSTLLKNFTGLLFPKQGELSVNGYTPRKDCLLFWKQYILFRKKYMCRR